MNWEKKAWKFIASGSENAELRMYLIHSIKNLTGVLDETAIINSLNETNPMILVNREKNQAIMPPGERATYFQKILKVTDEVSKIRTGL